MEADNDSYDESVVPINKNSTLLKYYINDLSLFTKELGMSTSLYADDAVIYCSNYDSYL